MPASPGGPVGGLIQRSTLRQQIADALRDEVTAGRLPPGRQFTVKEIAEQYGVSATPVREALLDLTAQGLLDVEQHRGFRVHTFSVDDFRAMVGARTLIVEGVFRGAAQHPDLALDPTVLAAVTRRAEEAERAARAGDLDVLIGYELRFWREICRLVDNPYITGFLDRLRVQAWVFAVPLLRRRGDLRGRLWQRHRALAGALQEGDLDEVQRMVLDYNEHCLSLVRDLGPPGPPALR
ncbi:GntR family transcriptional regulator [Streptomyces sp. NPDC059740]|uniref:GntR family transcriptional regulator n=1 Tax=Streptomyces sp. NPDC059740 TaxID=3346926 RepID=UPI00364DC419